MKILLKDFQVDRSDEFVGRLRRASRYAAPQDLQAVLLASPTGSGKTVIATAAIERIIAGDPQAPPDEDATFLWITDQPDLNEQTRRKMLATSSFLAPHNLIAVDSTFDAERFQPGNVYFLNTQKLGKNTGFVTTGDKRTHTLWDTIANTATHNPRSFYVFIDEAHRGMTENPAAREEARTIIQKFIKGSPGEIPPVPLIVGITATPEHFTQLLKTQPHSQHPVIVTTEEVRSSGLLKDYVAIYHPTEHLPSDMSMLRAAVKSWKDYTGRWAHFCDTQSEAVVSPVLVIQVQDGDRTRISHTNLADVVGAVEAEVGPLPPSAYAHAFQSGGTIEVGENPIRYLAPADIDHDPDVQVVLFKTSLNTGWDCPRAETMMSYRTAHDSTSIAQLIGRMVRTPLARHVDADEFLNSVTLYLPHYNRAEVQTVIDELTSPDPFNMAAIKAQTGEDTLFLTRAQGSDDQFEGLEQLTSYVVPKPRRTSAIRRIMKLARLLSNDELAPDAISSAQDAMLDVMRSKYDHVKDTPAFAKIVGGSAKLRVQRTDWEVLGDLANDGDILEMDLAPENIDDSFEALGRRLGEGLHKTWWKSRCSLDPAAKTIAKLEFCALSADGTLQSAMEIEAATLVQAWLKQYQPQIRLMPEADRQAYDEVRQLASDPERTNVAYPTRIEGHREEALWERHLYVDEHGLFPCKLNTWEARVVRAELEHPQLVAWLRNPDRKHWSLRVPYLDGGVWKSLYPDFVFIRQTDQGLVFDILDPHRTNEADAAPKAVGLATYAAKHAQDFGRIELIMVDGSKMYRLDLTDETMRNRVREITTSAQLRTLYTTA